MRLSETPRRKLSTNPCGSSVCKLLIGGDSEQIPNRGAAMLARTRPIPIATRPVDRTDDDDRVVVAERLAGSRPALPIESSADVWRRHGDPAYT
jgi:hypothetical protein